MVEELIPDPWMLGAWKSDPERGARCYRRKLHTIGLERIRAQFDELAEFYEADLALCCFEADPTRCHRSQFAAVWERWIGEAIHDLSLLRARDHGAVALVHELERRHAAKASGPGDLVPMSHRSERRQCE